MPGVNLCPKQPPHPPPGSLASAPLLPQPAKAEIKYEDANVHTEDVGDIYADLVPSSKKAPTVEGSSSPNNAPNVAKNGIEYQDATTKTQDRTGDRRSHPQWMECQA